MSACYLRSLPKLLVFSFILFFNVSCLAQTIATIAGNGIEGYSGDGWPATAANLNYPFGVAVDTGGNVYVADHFNNCIRKVAPSGLISTIVGTGNRGYSGDGGAATDAELNWPTGLAVDRVGNLYIADESNDCIRKVDTAGIIRTIAGTGYYGFNGDGRPATSASLYYPWGVAVDTSGNVYIADQFNQRVRKVDTAGIISTIAGNGTNGYSGDAGPATDAQLYYPVSVAADNNGNVYIADKENNGIRKVRAGVISTFAGTGSGGYNGDDRMAVSAELNGPTGVALDNSGNVYIADAVSNRIRMVNPAGIINTLAGTGTAGFSVDGALGTAAQLYDPEAIAIDGSGNLFIADASNFRVRKVTRAASELKSPPYSLALFPNPNQGTFTIVLTAPATASAQVSIINVVGQKVSGFTMAANTEWTVQLQVPRGVYFLTAIIGNQKLTAKIVVG